MVFELDLKKLRFGTELLKRGFARMQKGGVVMDVTNDEQARIAEEAGAVAVMALERVPADIRAEGGVARMADPQMIKSPWHLLLCCVISRLNQSGEDKILGPRLKI